MLGGREIKVRTARRFSFCTGRRFSFTVTLSPQSAGTSAYFPRNQKVCDAKGAVVKVREVCDLDAGQKEQHVKCLLGELEGVGPSFELRREDGSIGLGAERGSGEDPRFNNCGVTMPSQAQEISTADLWVSVVKNAVQEVSTADLGYSKLEYVVELPWKGEDSWILLQFETVSRKWHDRERYWREDKGIELWAVPKSDMRLSSGVPLGFWPSLVSEHSALREAGGDVDGLETLSGDPRFGNSILTWCVSERHEAQSLPLCVAWTKDLLALLPGLRRRFERSVLKLPQESVRAAAPDEGNTDGYDFECIRNLGCRVVWDAKSRVPCRWPHGLLDERMVESLVLDKEVRIAIDHEAWGGLAFILTDETLQTSALYLRKVPINGSRAEGNVQSIGLSAVSIEPRFSQICGEDVFDYRWSLSWYLARRVCTNRGSRRFWLEGSAKWKPLRQAVVKISTVYANASHSSEAPTPPTVLLALESEPRLPHFLAKRILEVRHVSSIQFDRELLFFVSGTTQSATIAEGGEIEECLYAMDVETLEVARLTDSSAKGLTHVIESENELLFCGSSNDSASLSMRLSITAAQLSKASFSQSADWADESVKYDMSFGEFTSRSTDKSLVDAAFEIRAPAESCRFPPCRARFSYCRKDSTHPLRFWVVAGRGPVPTVLRAPEGIYREMLSGEELGDYLGCSLWVGIECDGVQLIEERTLGDWVNERRSSGRITYESQRIDDIHGIHGVMSSSKCKWVGVLDVRDDGTTTVDNINSPPPGSEEVIMSSEEIKQMFTYKPPTDEATGRPYFMLNSGDLLAIDPSNAAPSVAVAPAARGRWFWKIDTQQAIVWHESVDSEDRELYASPCALTRVEFDVIRKASRKYKAQEVDTLETARDKWQKALERAAEFVDCTGVKSELALRVQQLLAHDPLSTYWKAAVLPDGFIVHIQPVLSNGSLGFFDASKFRDLSWILRPDKLVFIKAGEHSERDAWKELVEACMKGAGNEPYGMPSGCAFRREDRFRVPSSRVHFKFHPKTHEIVAARFAG